MLRRGEQLARRTRFEDLSTVHEHDTAGDLAREAHFVRHDEHRHVLFRQFAHRAQHFAGQFRVQRRGRLVEQHDVRFHRQRAGNGDTLLLAAREARRIAAALVEQADLFQQDLCLRDDLLASHTLDRDRRLDDVLQHGHVREQVEVLENHAHLDADAADVGFRHVVADAMHIARHQRFAFDDDAPAVDRLKVIETAQEGALARAGRADHGDHLALGDIERNALQHFERAEALVHVVGVDHRICRITHRTPRISFPDAGRPASTPAS